MTHLPKRIPVVCGLVLAMALSQGTTASAAPAEENAQRAIHLLDYIAVDYRDAVQGGVVTNELEFAEQVEFAGRAALLLAELDASREWPELDALDDAIATLAEGDRVEHLARALSTKVRAEYGVGAALREAPSRGRGAKIYADVCASCHGSTGGGDGPAGRGLDPAPSNLRDPARVRALSPYTIYSTIRFGIDGTAMVAFGDQYPDTALFDLAFFVAGFSHDDKSIGRGRALAESDPERAAALVPNLEALLHRAPATAKDADDRALLLYLQNEPHSLVGGVLPIEITRRRLAEALDAATRGDNRAATSLAISAYLDGFERVETSLSLADGALVADIENDFLGFRAALDDGADLAELGDRERALRTKLDRAEGLLRERAFGKTAAFVSSFAILAREGLEAILVIAAILMLVRREGRGRATRVVHASWLLALCAGALTWWAAGGLIEMSGARREVVEGIAALLAAAVLFWISYWLLSRIEARRWQNYLRDRVGAALAGGSLFTLGTLTFLAVYREAFETVLFYQALVAQSGASGIPAILAGAGAAITLLVAAGWLLMRAGERLPLRAFFALSSVLLYTLAVIFLGHGVAALQEAGYVAIDTVRFARIPLLGIYPTLQGLVLQGVLVALALFAWLRMSFSIDRREAGVTPS